MIEERLRELGLVLPPPLPPISAHASVVVSRGVAYVAGHGPMDEKRQPVCTGPVGGEVSESEGKAAARLSALNAISSLRAELGDLDRVEMILRLTGYVLSAPNFVRQPWVTDGASELLAEVFGTERGRHARTSVGVATSALSMSVSIDLIVAVS
ncbi:MAG: RidA family protein [Candidatus Dormiibacterota bacterium]